MPSFLLFAAIILAQAPAQRPVGPQAPTAGPKRDTLYVASQSPPPAITVAPPNVTIESPSDLPTMVLGIVGAILLAFQLIVMGRQTRLMSRQTDAMKTQGELMAKQTVLGEQQATWQRDEAIGTFYRIAHDLAGEFQKANVLPSTIIPANYETHPRQMLREAARLFAPLGASFVFPATATAQYLDRYFEAVQDYNSAPASHDGRWEAVQRLRWQVGRNLDATNLKISAELRWRPRDAADYDFSRLCTMPTTLAEQMTGDPNAFREEEKET